jgi:hypothetical protein
MRPDVVEPREGDNTKPSAYTSFPTHIRRGFRRIKQPGTMATVSVSGALE